MSVCDYIGTSYPGGKGAHKKFYALLPRKVSDELTRNLVNHLANHSVGVPQWVDGMEPYDYFRSLPAADPLAAPLSLIQAHALFSKSDDMLTDIDQEGVAYESFLMSEFSCRTVNTELSKGIGRINARECRVIRHHASAFIAEVLGACPALTDLDFTFGPGANVSSKGDKHSSPNVKLSGRFTVSNSLLPFWRELEPTLPYITNVQVVCGRLEFVPKSFKTKRSILLEPGVNSALQKGAGKVIKRCLRRIGLLTEDAQDIQRLRALKGSKKEGGEDFVTIDLSRASDSIAWHLVLDLLPFDWFQLLDALRTPLARYKGKLIELEKFSSMGNGYTFELETLLFKGLIRGIAAARGIKDDSIVYGDDITCNAALGAAVVELLPEFGFEVNKDKSFLTGHFKEACGGDYRDGQDVRPWFLRSLRDGGRWNVAKLFSFYNFLKRKPQFDIAALSSVVLAYIPALYVTWGPDGFGDGHLITSDLTYSPEASAHYQQRCYHFYTYAASPYQVMQEAHPALPAYASYNGLSAEDQYAFDECRYPKDILLVSGRKRIVVSGEDRDLYSVSCPTAVRRRDSERKLRVTIDRIERGYIPAVNRGESPYSL